MILEKGALRDKKCNLKVEINIMIGACNNTGQILSQIRYNELKNIWNVNYSIAPDMVYCQGQHFEKILEANGSQLIIYFKFKPHLERFY